MLYPRGTFHRLAVTHWKIELFLLTNFWHLICDLFWHWQPVLWFSDSLTPADPTIQFNSDTVNAELASAQSHNCLPLQRPVACSGLPVFLLTRGSHHPLVRFNNLLKQLTELRKVLYLHLPVFIKDATQEQIQMEEIVNSNKGKPDCHRVRKPAGEVLLSTTPSTSQTAWEETAAVCF